MKPPFDIAKRLRLQSRDRVTNHDLPAALALLDEALTLLEDPELEASQELYRDLAETHGMRGGVLRRLQRRPDAVDSYKKGLEFERHEALGAPNTYNLVNSIVLPLYDQPELLGDDSFKQSLIEAVRVLRRQILASRAGDFWAQADLARLLLLRDQLEEAKPCIDRFVQLGGLKEGYGTTLQSFNELSEALLAAERPEAKAFQAAIELLRAAVEHGSSLERASCFVLMPFGKKPSPNGEIDFDFVYTRVIAPAIKDAGLEPTRADAEQDGGVIHKAMFERLLISEFAVADLTLNNPNVFYELGVRHGNRARVTVLMSAEGAAPFDVALLRTFRYRVQDGKVVDADIAQLRSKLSSRLREARQEAFAEPGNDNPIFALLQDFKSFDVPSRLKADVFRDKAAYTEEIKRRLAVARAQPRVEALRLLRDEEERIPLEEGEPAAAVDLLLSYRGIEAWDDMLTLCARLPKVVRDTEFVREQQALALNRRNRGADRYLAVEILEKLIAERGASSEAYALMGRIYKDQWSEVRQVEPVRARGLLKKAIDAYRKGFDSDIRDAFPGINLLTLLEVLGTDQAREEQLRLLPIVRHAAELRVRDKPDYWDYATLLELAVLGANDAAVGERLDEALGAVREPFEPATTARNLQIIAEARKKRGEASEALTDAITELERKAKS